MKPYATCLREHLAESRTAGLPWEAAWAKALRSLTPETDFPICRNPSCDNRRHSCRQIKGWYRDGYLRVGGSLAGVSTLAERRDMKAGEAYVAPDVPDTRQCGWGEGCHRMGAPWLCAEHSEIIQAIAGRLADDRVRDLRRGGLSFRNDRAECVTPGCSRFASRGEMHCGRHGVKQAA